MRPPSAPGSRGSTHLAARQREIDLRKRVAILFVAGVAVPSGLLGYLALRGVRNDQALFEREQREELQGVGRQAMASYQARLTALESRARAADAAVLDEPLVRAAFELTSSGEVVGLTTAHTLYEVVPALWTQPSVEARDPEEARLAAVRQLELGTRDLGGAEAGYVRLLSEATSRRVQAEALNGLARVSRRQGKVAAALEGYRRLVAEYGDVGSGADLPFAVVGRLELLSTLEEASDVSGAAGEVAALLDGLLRGEHELSATEYGFVADRARDAALRLAGLRGERGASDAWADSLGILLVREEEAQRRSDQIRGFVVAAAARPDELRALAERSLALGAQGAMVPGEGGAYPVYAFPISGGAPGVTATVRGLLLDPDGLAQTIRAVAHDATASRDLRWVLQDESGSRLAASDDDIEEPTVALGFPARFPPLTLGLLPPPAGTVESFFASPRSVYLYAFFLVMGILAGGLALTVRTLSHQLELARMQSDFVSTVSHELKSPLTSIRQLAEMLQAGRVPSEERRQRYLDVLVEQSERLTSLIDHVLDFARMDSGRTELDLVEVDLERLLGDLISEVQERVRHRGFVVRGEIAPRMPLVTLDRDAIVLATTNMIDNGIKYSGDSREVVVRAGTENGHAVIAVQDFGIGLDPAEQERVFERFYRGGEALTRSVKGTGLGLTLVKQIVEAHGGSVAAESESGKGTTFTLRIPVRGP